VHTIHDSKKIHTSPTLFRLPKPSRFTAAVFHSGNGGMNWMLLMPLLRSDSFSTPRGRVISTASALYVVELLLVREWVVITSTPSKTHCQPTNNIHSINDDMLWQTETPVKPNHFHFTASTSVDIWARHYGQRCCKYQSHKYKYKYLKLTIKYNPSTGTHWSKKVQAKAWNLLPDSNL